MRNGRYPISVPNKFFPNPVENIQNRKFASVQFEINEDNKCA